MKVSCFGWKIGTHLGVYFPFSADVFFWSWCSLHLSTYLSRVLRLISEVYNTQSSKLTDVSHHKGELSLVSKLRLQLMYDLWELFHKIWGIIFRRPDKCRQPIASEWEPFVEKSTQMCEKQMKKDAKKKTQIKRRK